MIHILGIAGTFMAGVAALAKEAGIEVSGSDQHVYPPMSTLLETLNIDYSTGYDQTDALKGKTIVIGNALSRGNPAVEYTLNNKLPYTSGAQWLHENVLGDKKVLAVAGTHGKTTTASILAWILEQTGHGPGFLIGGKPGNFDQSARLGSSQLFVVEADEYDTAFFDKRSKFVHYHPHIAILNNLEFDHADIFTDLDAIKTQFHHLIRTIPQNGTLVVNADDANLPDVLKMGCWTPVEYFSTKDAKINWFASANNSTISEFDIQHDGETITVNWQGMGEHNMSNALAAVVAAVQAEVPFKAACQALTSYTFPNKRLQRHATQKAYTLFEDFAHHPTAIEHTLTTLRKAYPEQRIVALLELRSNTMKMGIHQQTLAPALNQADIACVVNADNGSWELENNTHPALFTHTNASRCLEFIEKKLTSNDIVVVMSNGNFDGIVDKLQ